MLWEKASRYPPRDDFVGWHKGETKWVVVYWKTRTTAIEQKKNEAYNKAIAPAWKAYYEAVDLAQKAYQEAVAPARKARDEAIASAQKAHNEAIAPAWKAYYDAIASAQKAYEEATAPAQKAYDEALALAEKAYYEAVAPAEKAYDEAFASAKKTYQEAIAPAQIDYESTLVEALLGRIADPPSEYVVYRKDDDKWLVTNDSQELKEALEEVVKDQQAFGTGLLSTQKRLRKAAESGALIARFEPLRRREIHVREHKRRI